NGYKTNTPRNGVYYTCVNGVWTDNTKTCPEGYRYAEGFEISAYCDCFCTAGATCTTKSPAHTILATDVSVIPRGSRVIIPSLGITGVSEDTGGYIQGKRIDVYIPSYSRALAFGRKYNVGVCISNAQQSLGSPQCQAIQNPRCEEKNPVTGIIDCVRTGDSGAKYGLRGLCYP
ncbi:3D domain-containing protein, partial [Candidatus Pacearchaeota archaeon]|nr:3D domain-containing protein [Candidatus Pacearchaeota archaeon]